MLRTLTIVLPTRLECLAWLGAATRGIARELLSSDAAASLVELAVIEMCSNVIRHGHPGNVNSRVEVVFGGDDGRLDVEIRNEGPAFSLEDPGLPAIEVESDFDDLPTGGFGIPMVHASMDSVEYSRDGNVNVIRISKRRSA